MSLEFSTFAAEHFEPYVQWFEDESLNKQLGPAPNQEWLEHVLHDATGKQYSVFRAEELVAVVGVVFATKENPVNVISDLAIKPILRSTGLGRQVLAALPLLEEYDAAEDWASSRSKILSRLFIT